MAKLDLLPAVITFFVLVVVVVQARQLRKRYPQLHPVTVWAMSVAVGLIVLKVFFLVVR